MIFRYLALKYEKPYVQKLFNPIEIFKRLTISYNENLQDNWIVIVNRMEKQRLKIGVFQTYYT